MRKSGPEQLLGLVLSLLDVLFLAALLGLPVLWIGTPFNVHFGPRLFTIVWHFWYCAAPMLLLAMRSVVQYKATRLQIAGAAFWEQSWFRHIALSLVATFTFFGAVEVTLKCIKFEVQFPEVMFEGKNSEGKTQISQVENDPVLLWRFGPGTIFNGRRINRMGFREREVNPVKQPDTVRVVCMGDSVTAQGRPGYAEYLHRLLTNHPPTSQRWEAFNMAVYGYSSVQGLRLFELTKDRVRPDIVTLYFGWNDHWLNRDSDRQLMAIKVKPLAGHVMDALRNKRFFQLILWLVNPVDHLSRVEEKNSFHFVHRVVSPNAKAAKRWELRVPPDDYRLTLTAFIRDIRAVRAIPVLITAPRRHLAQQLVTGNHARSVAEAEQLHDQYLEITRAVAHDCRADLLDLARIMAGSDCDAFFRPDGIHFDYCELEETLQHDPDQQPGLMRIAQELDTKIRQIVTTEAWQTNRAHTVEDTLDKPAAARHP